MFILVGKTDLYFEGIATGASEAVKVSASELIENRVLASESDASDSLDSSFLSQLLL